MIVRHDFIPHFASKNFKVAAQLEPDGRAMRFVGREGFQAVVSSIDYESGLGRFVADDVVQACAIASGAIPVKVKLPYGYQGEDTYEHTIAEVMASIGIQPYNKTGRGEIFGRIYNSELFGAGGHAARVASVLQFLGHGKVEWYRRTSGFVIWEGRFTYRSLTAEESESLGCLA